LIPRIINRGIAPIVFEAASTAANIKKYLQKAFFPVNEASR
jgi:hypothetical protein